MSTDQSAPNTDLSGSPSGDSQTPVVEKADEGAGDASRSNQEKRGSNAGTESSSTFKEDIDLLKEGMIDPVFNVTIKEIIYHSPEFIVYLDEKFRIRHRGEWQFPKGSEQIRFEVSRLESLSMGNQNFFGIKQDEEQLLAIRRLLAEVIANLHMANDVIGAQAFLSTASQTVTGVVTDNTRLKRVMASSIVTAFIGFVGWAWILFHPCPPGINIENEFGLWIPLGALGALLFSFMRMHSTEVRPFARNSLIFWESASRIMIGGISALLIVSAAKANLLLGVLSQPTSNANAFWGLLTLSILAGVSERLVPDFITRMDGSANPPAPTR